MLMREELPDTGVGSSGELGEPDDEDDMDAERVRWFLVMRVLMAMGVECFTV